MRKRILSLATVLAVMVVMLMPAPVMAASGGGPLVKQVNVYYYNTASKWEQFSRYTFTYGNSYPKKYTEVEYSLETQNRLEYKMMKGLPVSAKNFNSTNRNDTKLKYDKKGRLVKSVYGGLFNKRTITRTYKYNKQGFVTKYSFTDTENSPGIKTASSWKGTYDYKYTMAKGLPQKMTTTYKEKYSSGDSDTYVYTTAYNSKGLISSMVDQGEAGAESTVKYTYKNGKLASAVVYYKEAGGKATPVKKITFSYTGGKVKNFRYINMINSFIAGDSDCYGEYNWY